MKTDGIDGFCQKAEMARPLLCHLHRPLLYINKSGMDTKIILILAASFLLGSVPFGLILARLFGGVNLRSTGSGNIGATNVARTLGVKLGVATLVLDMAKGLAAVLAARMVWQDPVIAAAAGFCAFLGHLFSPFLGFKGGKGVSTALGVILATAPLVLAPVALVFVAVVSRWGYVSAGSIAAAAMTPPTALLLGYPPVTIVLTLAMGALIIIKHRENIGRLRRGEEKPWRTKNRENNI